MARSRIKVSCTFLTRSLDLVSLDSMPRSGILVFLTLRTRLSYMVDCPSVVRF
jgi:hypothetical protein